MTFANLPLGWVLAGLAGLAGVLFVLQRLRVRHREVTVVTTLFWREAVQEARARVLTDRFRHPLAYLLVLCAASLLWIAAAGPRASDDDGADHYVLLDASAGMAWTGAFDTARERLADVVASLPREHTTVVVCGARPRTVLLPGESELLLERRIKGMAPDACPDTVSATVREIRHGAGAERPVHVHVIGNAGPRSGDDGRLRVTRDGTIPRGVSGGVVRLGVADAASGAWTAVDVLVEAQSSGLGASDVRVTLDGTELRAATRTYAPLDPSRSILGFRDVPANGGKLTASMPGGDPLSLDDGASCILPARSPISVAVPEDCPPALLAALRADTAVRLAGVGEPADVVVTRDASVETPAIVLARESEQGDAFVVTLDTADLDAALIDAYDELALSQIDATSLATAAGREIRISGRFGDAPQLRVWESLLTDRYDLIAQRAFPSLVARAVRRLAGAADVVAVSAAGRELPSSFAPLRAPDGTTLDPAGGALVPQEAGAHVAAGGHAVEVALLDAAATTGTDALRAGESSPASSPAPTDLALWAGLLACGLLAAEWILHRGERIP